MSFTICGLCGDPATINQDGKVICRTCKTIPNHKHQSVEEKVKCTKCVKEDYPKGVKS